MRAGGGISGSRVEGRAVSVIKGRFEDCCCGLKEEKAHLCARKQRKQRREDEAGGGQLEANRRMLAMEGVALLRDAMTESVRPRRSLMTRKKPRVCA